MFKKSQKQNYPLLQSIISNMQQNPSMSKLTDFVNQTNEIFDLSIHQTCANYQVCSKHQQKKGDYFQAEYPWIKYCENCALNLALCGKKIQKSLNSQQMLTKIKLSDTLQAIGEAIKISQRGHQQYSFLSTQLQQSRQWFASILGQIDGLISQLSEIRNSLQENVQAYVNKQIREIFEKQSLMVSKKIQLIKQKSQIECGFVDLIGKQNENDTFKVIEKSRQLIKQAENLISTQTYKSNLAQNIKNVETLFQQKLTHIKRLQQNLNLNEQKPSNRNQNMRMSVAFSKKILNYRTSKTEQTLEDDISYQQGKRLLTACSTIQHSGLVTPSEINHDTPLGQLNQNCRNSRTALQLKARCRSKSGSKKVEVNVRQSIENAVRKKLS